MLFVPHRLFESIHLGQTSWNVDQARHSCDPKYQGPSSHYHQSWLLPQSVLGSHGPVLCSHSWQVVWTNWWSLPKCKLVTLDSFQTACVLTLCIIHSVKCLLYQWQAFCHINTALNVIYLHFELITWNLWRMLQGICGNIRNIHASYLFHIRNIYVDT